MSNYTRIVAVGNIFDGFEFYGPFADTEDAVEYGERTFDNRDWLLVTLASPSSNTVLSLDDRELAAVLAGLRLYQLYGDEMVDIATNLDEFAPLSEDEVDDLCERING